MDRWTAITWGLVSGAGTMLFLKVVAVQIAYGEGLSKMLEKREEALRTARRRAVMEAEIIETELASKDDAA